MTNRSQALSRAERRRRQRLAKKRGAAESAPTINAARGHHETGELGAAEADYRAILRAQPRNAVVLHLLGVLLLQTGRIEEALTQLETADRLSPNEPDILNNLGEGERLSGNLEAAESAYRNALALEPSRAGTLNNLALVLKARGELDAAEVALRKSLSLDGDEVGTWLNLADLLSTREQFEAALTLYDGALERAPRAAPAHYGRAYALYVLDRLEAAESAAKQAVRGSPGDDKTVELLARIHVASGNYVAASETFLTPVKRRHGKTVIPSTPAERRRLYRTNRIKLSHDLEQLSYVIDAGDAPAEFEELAAALREALRRTDEREPTEHFDVDELSIDLVTRTHNRLVRDWYPQPRPGGALNPELDAGAIEERFLDGDAGLVYFDDYLHPEALRALQRFALTGSCWFMTDHGAEVGATPSTGFCCPLLMQIAGETRERFPRLLGRSFFNTLWGLKFYQTQPGVGRHIDDGAMSINFWLTPNTGNLNPNTGGLLYWNKEITEAGFFEHTTAEKFRRLDSRLNESDAELLRVPYRCNRAMLFRSSVIHGTEEIDFSTSYAERRINITCLYGRSQSSSLR